jgi:hypothetical protein
MVQGEFLKSRAVGGARRLPSRLMSCMTSTQQASRLARKRWSLL